MRYRIFPGTDLSVSEIGFGTWTLSTSRRGEKTDDEAVSMLRRAHHDFGITFFDAAANFGVEEEPMAYKGTMDRVTS